MSGSCGASAGVGRSGMAHSGQHLDPWLRLGGQCVVHPLPVVVEDTGDLLATLLVAAPLDGFQLSLQVQGQLLQLAGLRRCSSSNVP